MHNNILCYYTDIYKDVNIRSSLQRRPPEETLPPVFCGVNYNYQLVMLLKLSNLQLPVAVDPGQPLTVGSETVDPID